MGVRGVQGGDGRAKRAGTKGEGPPTSDLTQSTCSLEGLLLGPMRPSKRSTLKRIRRR